MTIESSDKPKGHEAEFAYEKEPAGQDRQLADPADAYVPAPHVRHTDDDAAPTDVEYIPATQFTHDDAPDPDHVPAPHSWHVAFDDEPTTADHVPASHSIQAPA